MAGTWTGRSWIVGAVAGSLLLGACISAATEAEISGTSDVAAGEFTSVTPELTPKADLQMADPGEVHVTYAPDVPPTIERDDQRIFEVHLEVLEGVCPLDPANDVTTLMWGYRINGDEEVTCGTPGPVLRGRVGDIARITMTNRAENKHPHNIDFHAVTGQGGGAADLLALPGETKTIEARLLYPGAFMYHCAAGDVPEHIARGMYGIFIVDPETPLPPADHEWAITQSEWYVTEPDADGVVDLDRDALTAEEPRYVTFNGRTDALTGDNALRMQVGERARIYLVNEGLNLDSNWHPIGSHWDTVYPEAATHPINRPIRGSQSTLVVAGGGTVTEIVGQVPSTIILVDHALVRTFYKGAIGQIIVEGDEDPEVFIPAEPPADAGEGGTTTGGLTDASESEEPSEGGGATTDEVIITEGAYNEANAETAYSPSEIVVKVGTTVTWTNEDLIFHTVTSGTSDGRSGSADGSFDSGEIQQGESWSYTFDEVGTFDYFCVPHPWMRGKVVVEE